MATIAQLPLLLLVLLVLAASGIQLYVQGAPAEHAIEHVPGYNGELKSKHYAGYISVDEKSLFYYFVASERDPVRHPGWRGG
jgi:hypothetical protein